MEKYESDEIDITQWEPKIGDEFLLSLKMIDINRWKGELHRSFGLYYKTTLWNDDTIQELLKLGWELQQK